jgi:hypothetical protein
MDVINFSNSINGMKFFNTDSSFSAMDFQYAIKQNNLNTIKYVLEKGVVGVN